MAIKLKIGGGDTGKKTTKVKVSTKATPADVEAANRFAKDFALRKGLISGENTHTGGVVPPFVDPAGKPVVGPAQVVAPAGMLSNKVPSEIKSLEWDTKAGLPYYIDPQSGDTKYVNKELFYLPRFRRSNPLTENPLGNSIVKR